jgi:hypothetical protein
MDRLAGDVVGIVLSCLTLNERLDGMGQVSRMWRSYTRTSLLMWARRQTLSVSLGYYDTTYAGPVRFVRKPEQEEKEEEEKKKEADSERNLYQFVVEDAMASSLSRSAAPMKDEVRIEIEAMETTTMTISCSHKKLVESVQWSAQERGDLRRGTHGRIGIHVGAASIVHEEHYTLHDSAGVFESRYNRVNYVAPLTVVSLTLTAKDIAWIAPVSARNRLSLLCMLVDETTAAEMRTTLHAIMRYGALHPPAPQTSSEQYQPQRPVPRVRNLYVLSHALDMYTCTQGMSTATLANHFRALLHLASQCSHLRVTRDRMWWFDHASLLSLLETWTSAGQSKFILTTIDWSQYQDERVQNSIASAAYATSFLSALITPPSHKRRKL